MQGYYLNLPNLDVLSFDLARPEAPELTLKEVLNRNNAVYHYFCSSIHNPEKLYRALEKFNEIQSRQNDTDTQSLGCKHHNEDLNKNTNTYQEIICCFCQKADTENNLQAAGTDHATQLKPNQSTTQSTHHMSITRITEFLVSGRQC